MKFRGLMTELSSIRKFYSILSSLARLAKRCVLIVNEDDLVFVLTESGGRGGQGVWASLPQSRFFSEYHMQGVTPEQNQIFIDMQPETLAKALNILKSTTTARSLKMKLTRKHQQPCLTFEIELSTYSAFASTTTNPMAPNNATKTGNDTGQQTAPISARHCLHDVPVRLLPRRLWPDFSEPTMPNVDRSITLPDLKFLRQLTERLKSVGNRGFKIEANGNGHLKLVLEDADATVVTHIKRLQTNRLIENQERNENVDAEDKELFVSVKLELKQFSLLLSLEQIAPKRVICNLVQEKLVQLLLVHEDVCLQCLIPALRD